MSANPQSLFEKIQTLPLDRLAKVEDFVDFIRLREQERALVGAAASVSASAFATVWSNRKDDVYDAL
jgi:hypothetical protein